MRKAIALAICLWSGFSMASDIEEPAWQLLEKFDGVELRVYAPSIQAQTTLDNSRQTSTGFRRLAGFIFGGNDKAEKIAMTAPVQETLVDESPVMAFTMPSAYALQDLPVPADPRISFREIPERTVAAIRFSGWATPGRVASNTEKLLAALRARGMDPVGGPALNQYNPPWTPPFLRRNEIVVEVGEAGTAPHS